MLDKLEVLSEYQEGLRNAKTYMASNNKYGVIAYDANLDIERFYCFDTEQIAEDFAEDWVLKSTT
jgi:hypothetical protein